MNIAMLDDDASLVQPFYDVIAPYIDKENDKFISYQDPVKFLNDLSATPKLINVLFLDIEMPSVKGIDLTSQIVRYNRKIIIVFLTNNSSYISDAFNTNVLAYVTKKEFPDKVQSIFTRINDTLEANKSIIVKLKNANKVSITISDITHITKSLKDYTIYLNDTTEYAISATTLDSIYSQLNSNQFIYISRSTIVNLDYVARFNSTDMLLTTGAKLEVAKNRYNEIEANYIEFTDIL